MKVVIYGWKEGMKKLPLSNYLVDNYGFKRSDSVVYNLFKDPPEEIAFEIDPKDSEIVEKHLQDFGVEYKLIVKRLI